MELLFSYGSLQYKDVQQALFKKELIGAPDVLVGFQLILKKAYGKYPVITKATNAKAEISGFVYAVSAVELQNVDEYEGNEYTRIATTLKSGKEAWVYIAKLP